MTMRNSFNENFFYGVYRDNVGRYPTPLNINYAWNFGSLAGIFLVLQILTGIILAMSYSAHVDLAFSSIEHIMRDVQFGWLLRYAHANGASFFFLIVFLHMARGIYYGSFSYPRRLVWFSGVILLILMIATAFMGYVLPWGQMSYWAATVITNLFSVIPGIGAGLVEWLWGGFSVGNPTLNRFFSLHYLLPFLIAVVAIVHLFFLNLVHSNNPLGVKSYYDYIPFHPYFTIKDLVGLFVVMFVYCFFVFFYPNYLGHPDNYIYADSVVTPAHIVPEWYYLPLYGILRCVADKMGGVLLLAFSLLLLLVLGVVSNNLYRRIDNRGYRLFYWFYVFNLILLGWLGAAPLTYPFLEISQLSCLLYIFTSFLIFINGQLLTSSYKRFFYLFKG